MPSLLLASASLLCLSASGPAPPGLPDKPARWQYAELTYRSTPAQPGGTRADGSEVAPRPATETIRWVSAAGEVEAKGWADLAERLKAPALKKGGSASYLKIQLLDHLGSEGWELMGQSGTATTGARATGLGPSGTWLFKRRVP